MQPNGSQITPLDLTIIFAYLALSLITGLWFTRRGTRSIDSFFVGERRMPWWLAGVSITATAFAADTPMWIGDMIYRRGIEGVWLHWAPGIGAAFYVFAIAPLWRRCRVMTDLEFLELRYSGPAAAFMRGFTSLYYALFWNIMMMAVGTLSITTLMMTTLGWSKATCVLVTVGTALIYSTASGIWGVCAADFLQFFVYLLGSTLLAIFAWNAAGGGATIVEALRGMTDWQGSQLNVIPDPTDGLGLPAMTIAFLFACRWFEHTNFGFFVSQRLFSTSSSRHALWAALLWVILYWSVIPLPWIITILAAKVHLPELANGQEAYVRMAAAVLPSGLRGLLIAALIAAFMSTYSSLINWGASYLINDLYRRFVVRSASTRHYVVAAQASMLPMALAAGLIAYFSNSILNLLFYVILVGAGASSVHFARWIWWRVNAWSEAAGLFGSVLLTVFIIFAFPAWVAPSTTEQYYGHRMFFVVIGTFVIWMLATLLTKPTPPDVLNEFYRRLRPPGFWGPIKRLTGAPQQMSMQQALGSWGLMLVVIFAPLVGLIKLCLGSWPQALPLLLVGAIATAIALRRASLYEEQEG